MDPLSGISLAGNVIQFLDFATNIVSKGHELYNSPQGALGRNLELEGVARRLVEFNEALRAEPQISSSEYGPRDKPYGQSMIGIAKSCDAVARELLEALDKLKVEGRHRKWKSIQQAFRSIWNQDKIDRLVQRLAQHRQDLIFHLLVPVR